jgi:hypothetical protein
VDARVDAGALGGGKDEVVGEKGLKGEDDARAAEDDPVGEGEELVGFAPALEVEEGVGADEDEDLVGWVEGGAEAGEGVDGIVGGVVWVGGFEVGGGESGVAGAEEIYHGEAVGEGGEAALRLERLTARGGEEHKVQ